MKIIIFVLLLSVGLNAYLLSPFNNIIKQPPHVQVETAKYPYLSQRLLQEFDRDLLINFIPLREELRKKIQSEYKNNLTLYFEYLPTGTSIGVNEKIEFYIASLLKTPFVMAYFHHIEANPEEKTKIVTIEEKHINKDFGALWQEGVGKQIATEKIVELILTESDNTAHNILKDQINQNDLNYISEGIDLSIMHADADKQTIMSVKGYSSILKALYFSSLLSKENSNTILELLSQNKFTEQLRAGVPSDVPVAHKNGVYEMPDFNLYSDCGIVYVPRRQYLLCMASRSDERIANERMKTVSKMVYDFVSNAEKSK